VASAEATCWLVVERLLTADAAVRDAVDRLHQTGKYAPDTPEATA
jgi:hypothetical protein